MSAVIPGTICADQQCLAGAKGTSARTVNTNPGVNLGGACPSEASTPDGNPRTGFLLDVPYYSQMDARWAALFTDDNGHNYGCMVTCIAMILAFKGCLDPAGGPVTPATLDTYLRARNGFDANHNLQPVDFTFDGRTYRRTRGSVAKPAVLNATLLANLSANDPVIAGVVTSSGSTHYVVVVGTVCGGNHLMNDPGRSPSTNKLGITNYRGYGANPAVLVPKADAILEATVKSGGQGYTLHRVDTLEPV